jgi:hypothetical protein
MGRIIHEDSVIALLDGKIDALQHNIDNAKRSAESDRNIKQVVAVLQGKLDVLAVTKRQLGYIQPYEPPKPRELTEADTFNSVSNVTPVEDISESIQRSK